MKEMIVINDLHKYFGDIEAVKGVDLTVDKAEVVAIVGPSGSGKNSLVSVAAGFNWFRAEGSLIETGKKTRYDVMLKVYLKI